jgi:hypothetical protein
VQFFEVHRHHRAAVKGWDKQRLVTSEMRLQAQLEVTVSAYGTGHRARIRGLTYVPRRPSEDSSSRSRHTSLAGLRLPEWCCWCRRG